MKPKKNLALAVYLKVIKARGEYVKIGKKIVIFFSKRDKFVLFYLSNHALKPLYAGGEKKDEAWFVCFPLMVAVKETKHIF